MRFAPLVGVGVCLAVLVWRVDAAAHEADLGWWQFTQEAILVAAAPFVVWNRPETAVGSYSDMSTLMVCFKGRG